MAIKFEKVNFEYAPKTVMAFMALKDVNLKISTGKVTAIIGATGSGKTTLVQHLNALLLPSSGKVTINNRIIEAHKKPRNLKELRKQVGLVFQFPEYQLFEESIEKDLCFGPINFGRSELEAKLIAKQCLKLVNLDESYLKRSPLDISGGQKRRVAIAGILAIEPDILVLDEPTAGLDPVGKDEMMRLFRKLNQDFKKTIIIVTHDFDNVISYCDDVAVMKEGRLVYHGEVQDLFSNDKLLEKHGIFPPAIVRLQQDLIKKGLKLEKRYFDISSLSKELKRLLR